MPREIEGRDVRRAGKREERPTPGTILKRGALSLTLS